MAAIYTASAPRKNMYFSSANPWNLRLKPETTRAILAHYRTTRHVLSQPACDMTQLARTGSITSVSPLTQTLPSVITSLVSFLAPRVDALGEIPRANRPSPSSQNHWIVVAATVEQSDQNKKSPQLRAP